MTTTEDRAAYVAGLRRLADAIESNPDLPLPYQGGLHSPIAFHAHNIEDARAVRRVLMPSVEATTEPTSEHFKTKFRTQIDGVHVILHVADPVALGTPTAPLPVVLVDEFRKPVQP